MSLVNEALKATSPGKRITYGIEIVVVTGEGTSVSLNEWGLHESQAKEVNELLTVGGDKPVVLGPMTFTRRKPSELSAQLAALKAKMQPVNV